MESLLASKERLKTGFLPLEQTTLIKVHLQQRLPLKVLLEFLVQLCDSHLYNRLGKDSTHTHACRQLAYSVECFTEMEADLLLALLYPT